MKNRNTKIKFTDIAGMLNRDEMKVIVGGAGASGGGGTVFSSGTALRGGFTGGAVAQSSFNGCSYLYGSGGTSAGGSSYNSIGSTTSSVSNSSWNTSGGVTTTSNPVAISRFYDLYMENNGVLNTSQITTFIANEATAAGQIVNNLQLYGTVLNTVNNYHGPTTIPQGLVINNGVLLNNPFGNGASGLYGSSSVNAEISSSPKFGTFSNVPSVIPKNNFIGWLTPGIKENCFDYAWKQLKKCWV